MTDNKDREEGMAKEETPEQEQAQEKEESEDIEQVKPMAAVAYLIFFLPLIVKPESSYGKFHANQGLLLLITAIGINIVGSLLPFIGWFLILPLGFIFTLVLFIIGIINAIKGKKKRLPLIGGFDIIK